MLDHFSEISSQIQAALRTATTQAFLARKGLSGAVRFRAFLSKNKPHNL
ncbi:hypothetical protein [Comamonas sp. CMM02]|nr:hypothetical protein [Comamonas sp. CMM02]